MWRRDEVPVMPKGRYKHHARLHAQEGVKLGLDMMLRTCTVQANLDFGSEADMVAKFRASPRAAADLPPPSSPMLALHRGQAQRLPVSARANVWTDTDPDRTGMLDFVFQPTASASRRYADYMPRRAHVLRQARWPDLRRPGSGPLVPQAS
jgi:glutamate--cysteine ligase